MNQIIKKEEFKTLSNTEQRYARLMASQNGVPYIKGRPGEAKSAILRSVAKKLDMQFFDLRLAEMDETEIGNYPKVYTDNESDTDYLSFIVPEWAIKANEKPTILIFEEINRAPLPILNAALKILFEREVGSNYKLNENVYMVATGNLGEEDGTFVNELDSALNNRLIHINHEMTIDEWIENFAKDNVHKDIVGFIKNNPASFYTRPNDNSEAYATPRTWTMLSSFIIENFGKDAKPNEYESTIIQNGASFVGGEINVFLDYIGELMKVSMDDILNNFKKYKDYVEDLDRSKKSYLISQLKEMEIFSFPKKKLNNMISFLNTIHEDERTGFLKNLIDDTDLEMFDDSNTNKNLEALIDAFKVEMETIAEDGSNIEQESDGESEDED